MHGVRYRGVAASDAISALRPQDRLELRWDKGNEVYPLAVLVLAESGTQLGYVPILLVSFVQATMTNADPDLRVVKLNYPDVGEHLRLLVRLRGEVESGFQPFETKLVVVLGSTGSRGLTCGPRGCSIAPAVILGDVGYTVGTWLSRHC